MQEGTIAPRRSAAWVKALMAGISCLALAQPASAAGDLLVAPTRVILNGNQGTEVVLDNIGAEPATYRISLELRRMLPTGELEDVPDEQASAVEAKALEMIRYAPRRITLAPDQPQSIRISARPGADLPDGEYRVHMSFRAIPEAKPVTREQAPPTQGFIVNLVPIYGVTIPIIVRKGLVEATAAVSNPQVDRRGETTFLRFDMTRSGNKSLYGEVRVLARGGGEPLFLARGVAIYPELSARTVKLPVSAEQAQKLRGPVRLEYREAPEGGGKLIAAVDANLG
ncbi:molecular chaperone [Novosphingobium tardum]|uniref:Molecular chaperone n=1 Tax=Novosphingobium tardum TaxID=1538021 RepID=A0ABV8RKL9_9SPHN